MKNALRTIGLFGTVAALTFPAVPGHASSADQVLISEAKVDKAALPCSGTATARWDRSENVLEVNSALTRRDMMAECEAKVTVNWLFNQRVVATVDRPLLAVRACTDDEACDSTVYDTWRKRVGAPDNTVPDSVKTQAEDISVQLTVEPEESEEDAAKESAKDAAENAAGGDQAGAAEKTGEMGETGETAMLGEGLGEGAPEGMEAGTYEGAAKGSEGALEPGSAEGYEQGYEQNPGQMPENAQARPRTDDAPGDYAADAARLPRMESTDCESVPPELLAKMPAGLRWESVLNS